MDFSLFMLCLAIAPKGATSFEVKWVSIILVRENLGFLSFAVLSVNGFSHIYIHFYSKFYIHLHKRKSYIIFLKRKEKHVLKLQAAYHTNNT